MTQPSVSRQKIQRRPVHGVLLLDKPLGLSSNQALQKAKWLLRADKAGHTGTLDPLATGVLPLCFGAATKFSQIQLDADKTYEALIVLGQKTSTGDAEGDVIETRPRAGHHARTAGDDDPTLHRPAGADPAHVFGAQKRRQGPVRICPQG